MRLLRNAALALLLTGCGSASDDHAVSGTVSWPGGALSGHTVEVASTADATVRGFGTIGPNGRFKLERLVNGKVAAGLPPGAYTARLILSDEGDGQTKKPKLPARYLDHKTAGWQVQVPPTGEVALTVSAK